MANEPRKLSLKEKLLLVATLSLNFVNIRSEKASDGTMIAILELAEPKEEVIGSQTYDDNGTTRNYKAYDVEEVRVHEDDFVDGFEFDENGTTGTYNGAELEFDVAKNGRVWLVTEKFSQAGNRMRREGRNNRVQEIINRQKEREAKAGVAPAPGQKLNPVETK